MSKIEVRLLDNKALEHLRHIAVKRVLEGGERLSAVMAALGLCRTTIYRWLQAHKAHGPSALPAQVPHHPFSTASLGPDAPGFPGRSVQPS